MPVLHVRSLRLASHPAFPIFDFLFSIFAFLLPSLRLAAHPPPSCTLLTDPNGGSVRYDNDRLSHWLAAVLFTWFLMFLFWGVLVFRLVFKVPLFTVIGFTLIACALHAAFIPWMFTARATPQNPRGHFAQSASAVILWLTLESLLFFYFIQRAWPNDPDSRLLRELILATIAGFFLLALVSVAIISRRRNTSHT